MDTIGSKDRLRTVTNGVQTESLRYITTEEAPSAKKSGRKTARARSGNVWDVSLKKTTVSPKTTRYTKCSSRPRQRSVQPPQKLTGERSNERQNSFVRTGFSMPKKSQTSLSRTKQPVAAKEKEWSNNKQKNRRYLENAGHYNTMAARPLRRKPKSIDRLCIN